MRARWGLVGVCKNRACFWWAGSREAGQQAASVPFGQAKCRCCLVSVAVVVLPLTVAASNLCANDADICPKLI